MQFRGHNCTKDILHALITGYAKMVLLLFWSLLAVVLADKYIPPDVPREVEVQAVNSTTIYVKWRPPRPEGHNGTILGYYVHYTELDENNDTIISTVISTDVNDDSRVEKLIYGLKPDTMYKVLVAAYTNEGGGIVSRPTIISTKRAVPSEPRFLMTELIQLNPPIAQVTWSKPEFVNGQLTGYKLYWGKKGEVYQQISLKPNQQSYITRSLDSGRVYEFRVFASNEIDFGERAVSDLVTPDSYETSPQNVSTIRLSPTTLQILWDEPSPNNYIGSYRVYYSKNETEDTSLWAFIDTEEPTRVALLTGLTPNVSIAVRMQAKYIIDRWSNLSKIITNDFLPHDRADVVQNFRPMDVISRQMTLSWNKPRKGEVDQYIIKYQGEKSYHNGVVEEIIRTRVHSLNVPGQKDNKVIKNLQPRMVYQFNITARFNDGGSGPQQSLQYQTKIEAPSFVPSPKLVRLANGSIMILALKPASEKNGPIAYYELIVIPEEYAVTRPQDFTEGDLTRDMLPHYLPATSPYIAARFNSRRLPAEFELGNMKRLDSFINRPLDANNRYRVFLRAYTVKQSFTSSDYSDPFVVNIGPNQTNSTHETPDQSGPISNNANEPQSSENSRNDTHEQTMDGEVTADGEVKANKRTSNDLIDAQVKYFEKQTKLTAVQKLYFAQRTRTEAIREKYLQELVDALEKGQNLHDHDI